MDAERGERGGVDALDESLGVANGSKHAAGIGGLANELPRTGMAARALAGEHEDLRRGRAGSGANAARTGLLAPAGHGERSYGVIGLNTGREGGSLPGGGRVAPRSNAGSS